MPDLNLRRARVAAGRKRVVFKAVKGTPARCRSVIRVGPGHARRSRRARRQRRRASMMRARGPGVIDYYIESN